MRQGVLSRAVAGDQAVKMHQIAPCVLVDVSISGQPCAPLQPDDCLRGRRIVFSGHDDGGQTEIEPVERDQKRLHNINMNILFSAADHLLRL